MTEKTDTKFLAEVETEIAKINENIKKYEENEELLQASTYVIYNEKLDEGRRNLAIKEAEEEQQIENELAKEIGLSFIRLKNKNSKIVIESTSKNKIIKFFI